MARRPNYGFQKHQKELKKQKKREAKREKKRVKDELTKGVEEPKTDATTDDAT